MEKRTPYDALAEIYDVWVSHNGPIMEEIRDFYCAKYVATPGTVVELGVGNGRILIPAAKAGKAVIGVDSSRKMLDLCRTHAIEAGVAERITLLEADFRTFELNEPAALISIPYDSIGHLVTADQKRHCFDQIYRQLAPGGQLVLDYDLYDPEKSAKKERRPYLHGAYIDSKTGREKLLWYTSIQDKAQMRRRVFVWTDEISPDGAMNSRMITAVENSWFKDEREAEELLLSAGFEIEKRFGDFQGGPITSESDYHILIARRPEESKSI